PSPAERGEDHVADGAVLTDHSPGEFTCLALPFLRREEVIQQDGNRDRAVAVPGLLRNDGARAKVAELHIVYARLVDPQGFFCAVVLVRDNHAADRATPAPEVQNLPAHLLAPIAEGVGVEGELVVRLLGFALDCSGRARTGRLR